MSEMLIKCLFSSSGFVFVHSYLRVCDYDSKTSRGLVHGKPICFTLLPELDAIQNMKFCFLALHLLDRQYLLSRSRKLLVPLQQLRLTSIEIAFPESKDTVETSLLITVH